MKKISIITTILLLLIFTTPLAYAETVNSDLDLNNDGVINFEDFRAAENIYEAIKLLLYGMDGPDEVDATDDNNTDENSSADHQHDQVAFTNNGPDDSGKCLYHDPNNWHSLYDEEAGCHYNHEHKADPHQVDHIFGDWIYQWTDGNTVSYPWQTGDTGVEENHHKHESYGYIVLTDLPPELSSSRDQRTKEDVAFVRDLRIQSHMDLNHVGIKTRFHSSFFELRICYKNNPNDCGIVRLGGHLDYEELGIDDDRVFVGNEPTRDESILDANVPMRSHSSIQNRDGSNMVTWRGRFRSGYTENTNGVTPFSYGGITHLTKDSFTLADPNDLDKLIFAPNPENNNSTHMIREMTFNMRGQMMDDNGRLNYQGWTKRYPGHRADDGCTQPSQDCVPISFENVPALSHLAFRSGSNGATLPWFEYDTSPSGDSWIEFPN